MIKVSPASASGGKTRKIALLDYYSSLPDASHPKTEFLNTLAARCNVSLSTVRNWVRFGMRPNNPRHIGVISEITGIKPSDLWED